MVELSGEQPIKCWIYTLKSRNLWNRSVIPEAGFSKSITGKKSECWQPGIILRKTGIGKTGKMLLNWGNRFAGAGKIAEYRRGRYKSLKEELRSKKKELVKYIEDLSHQEQDKYQY